MGSPTLAAKELGCANFEELRIKSKKMKSLRKKQADTLEEFLARIEECTANLGKLQDNVGVLKLVQAKVLAEPCEREQGVGEQLAEADQTGKGQELEAGQE